MFVRLAVASSIALCLAACGAEHPSPTLAAHDHANAQALLVNGDFEADAVGVTPSAWTMVNYLNQGLNATSSAPPTTFAALNLSAAGAGKNATFVVGDTTLPPAPLSQVDPDLGPGQSFRFPIYGGRATRVNYASPSLSGNNKNANSISQVMSMGPTDVDPFDGKMHVRFAVAPVLENPGHGYNQQPYYYIELTNLTRATKLYTAFNVAGQAGVPWRTTTGLRTGNATQWLDWQLVDIANDSSAIASGDQVKLTIVASGCSLGGHYGRIYVDGIGAFIPGPFVAAAAPTSVNSGSTLAYTFHYANGGTSNALGAHIDLTIPTGTTFNATTFNAQTGGACTMASGAALSAGATGAVRCAMASPLLAGASGTFTFTVNVTATSGTITNGTYAIGAANAPTLLGVPVSTSVIGAATSTADVVVTKTTTLASIPWGDTSHSCNGVQRLTSPPCSGITPLYTITIANNSTTKQLDRNSNSLPTFTDTMPAQLGALSGVFWSCTMTNAGSGTRGQNQTKCSDQSGTDFTGTGNISIKPRLGYSKTPCTGNNCAAGPGKVTIAVYGSVISGSGAGAITNTASSTSGSGVADPDLSNNTATATIPIGATATLSVAKTGSGSGTVVSSLQPGISCGATCSASFINGSQVVLNASAAAGSAFASWLGCTPNPQLSTQCTTTITGATNVNATFVAQTPGPVANLFVYSGGDQKALAPSAFTQALKVLVTDAQLNVLPGQVLTFLAPASGASAALAGGSACGSPQTYCQTATADASGIATISASANATVGAPYLVAATSGSASVGIKLTNYGPATTLSYLQGGNASDPGVATVSTDFASPLGALVTDSAGNPIPGVSVNFLAPASGASLTLSGGTACTSPQPYCRNALTDANGQAQLTATANAIGNALTATTCDVSRSCVSGSCISGFCGDPAQNYAVAASSTGLSGFGFVLRNVPAGATTMYSAGGSPQTTPLSSPFTESLVVAVADGLGNPVPGVIVTFNAPASGASSTLAGGSACSPAQTYCQRATTNALGLATITATSNATGGTYAVAVSSGALPALALALTNDGGQAIAAFAGSGQSAAFNTLFGTPLQAIVQDNDGSFPLVTVTFTAPASGPSVTLSGGLPCVPVSAQCQTALTNVLTGVASVIALANGSAGAYTVTATTPLAPGSASFTLTNTCTSNLQCSGDTPLCDTASTNACVACASNSQCAAKNPFTPYCDTTPGAAGACRACTSDSQCSGLLPICDPTLHACVGCANDAQCNNKDPGLGYCGILGACHACTADSQCPALLPGCDLISNICIALACPNLSAPLNGNVSATVGVTGDLRVYACLNGFLLNGSPTTTCLGNQTWSNPAPTCIPQACTATLSAPAHGSVSATSGSTGDVVTYACDPGFTLTGSSTTTCQADHTWSDAAPTCRCNDDAACALSGEWCDAGACTPKIPNGGSIPNAPGHTPVLDGTCTGPAASAVCVSAICDSDGKCGLVNAHGTCTTSGECRSGVCDTDGKCGYPNDAGPCSTADVCRSAICDASDNLCGYDDGNGPCTSGDAVTVCRGGACSAHVPVCVPSVKGCAEDADCGASEWCDSDTYTCKSKLPNQAPIPATTRPHTPTLNGACTQAAATAVCHSGVCDTANDRCGYTDGHPCGVDGECQGGDCSASGQCAALGGCFNDMDCTVPGTWCEISANTCRAPIPNGSPLPSDPGHTAPVVDGTCNPDAAVLVCESDVCDSGDHTCGYTDGHGPCTLATAGTVCRSSTCSPNGGICIPSGGCGVDADCLGSEWCDTRSYTCAAKVPNGSPIPTAPNHQPPLSGTCTDASVGASVCASGACDAADHLCGHRNGNGPCTSAATCRSGSCSASGVCKDTGACLVDGDCDVSAQFCDTVAHACQPKIPNGQPIPMLGGHAPPLDGGCSDAAAQSVCASGVCDADGRCGHGAGNGPCDAVSGALVCRTASCATSGPSAGLCVECASDAQCGGAQPACDSARNVCVQCSAAQSAACLGATPVCSSAGVCVDCEGEDCGVLVASCARDSDCDGASFCGNASACTFRLRDGDPAEREAQCMSGVITDGLCGGPAPSPYGVVVGGGGFARGCFAGETPSALWWLLLAVWRFGPKKRKALLHFTANVLKHFFR